MADLHSKILDAGPPPPPGDPNSFNFMQFLGKFGKIVCWCPPGELAPPPRGNPGSATVYIFIFKTTWKLYFKNNEKNTWKFTFKKPGNIMEFCQSEKVGTLIENIHHRFTKQERPKLVVLFLIRLEIF